MPHPIADTFGPNVADWLDTDEHRDQAHTLHQLTATKDGPYIAAAWLIGMNPHLNDNAPSRPSATGTAPTPARPRTPTSTTEEQP